MTWLVLGLVLFIGAHANAWFPGWRGYWVQKLGLMGYKGLSSIESAVGLGLIIYGKSIAPWQSLWVPPTGMRHATLLLVPLALILLAAAYLPGHIKRGLRHPMLLALLLWSTGHLLANGDVASVLLFGSLGVYSLVALLSFLWRPKEPEPASPATVKADILAVVLGIVAAGALVHFHATLFGVPVIAAAAG